MKQGIIAIRCFIALTLITGFLYPVIVTVSANALFPAKSAGSLAKNQYGVVVGSELIAQEFMGDRYFWPRPSAVGYNPLPSGGTNLGPTSEALREKWEDRRKKGLSGDMLSASASGLDPHISLLSASSQISRVARARNRSEEEVRQIMLGEIEKRQLGFLGVPKVNVLRLNLLLDENR